jgi:hypothetical protein
MKFVGKEKEKEKEKKIRSKKNGGQFCGAYKIG